MFTASGFKRFGLVLSLSGTSLITNYTASTEFQPGRARRLRFYVVNVRSNGSGATTTTVKLQFRYNDGTVQTAYFDLPSNLDDVQGSAQPKGPTFEIEHALTSTANSTTGGTFYLDKPDAIDDITVNVKVNATGQTGDSTKVYAVATAP